MKGFEGKTEGTPLVAGSSSAEPEKTPVEKMQTAGSIVLLVGIAVLKTQLTAQLFHYSNYPTAYSLWSCVVTCAILVPVFIVQYFAFGKPFQYPTRPMAQTLSLLVFFTALDLGFTNIALANISTALQQCIASTNPFWTIMLETALYQRFQHLLVYFAVCMLVVGAVLASVGSVSRLNALGVVAACVAVLCSASKYVFIHGALRKFKGELGSLALLFWIDLFMIPIYLVWTLSNGELSDLFNVAFADVTTFWQMTGTAALGGVRALTQMLVLAFVSATSMATANIFTQILNIVISIPIQNTDITPALIAGIVVVVVFSTLYTFIKAHKPFIPWFDAAVLGKQPTAETGTKFGSAAS